MAVWALALAALALLAASPVVGHVGLTVLRSWWTCAAAASSSAATGTAGSPWPPSAAPHCNAVVPAPGWGGASETAHHETHNTQTPPVGNSKKSRGDLNKYYIFLLFNYICYVTRFDSEKPQNSLAKCGQLLGLTFTLLSWLISSVFWLFEFDFFDISTHNLKFYTLVNVCFHPWPSLTDIVDWTSATSELKIRGIRG